MKMKVSLNKFTRRHWSQFWIMSIHYGYVPKLLSHLQVFQQEFYTITDVLDSIHYPSSCLFLFKTRYSSIIIYPTRATCPTPCHSPRTAAPINVWWGGKLTDFSEFKFLLNSQLENITEDLAVEWWIIFKWISVTPTDNSTANLVSCYVRICTVTSLTFYRIININFANSAVNATNVY
jgi:hypothetical protein